MCQNIESTIVKLSVKFKFPSLCFVKHHCGIKDPIDTCIICVLQIFENKVELPLSKSLKLKFTQENHLRHYLLSLILMEKPGEDLCLSKIYPELHSILLNN